MSSTGGRPNVGFIGLGNQGAPIAHRIAASGLPLHVWARRPESTQPYTANGAVAHASPKSLAQACDVVGICVAFDADVDAVVDGNGEGVLYGLRPGGVVAIHSTVSPGTVQRLDGLARERGVHVLDAPVSGGPGGARAGTMTVMVGGSAEAVGLARPVLETFASTIAHLGEVGTGQVMKLLNNNLCYANLAMSVSALEVVAQLGIDPAMAIAVIKVSSGMSTGFTIVSDPGLLAKATGPTSNISKDVGHFAGIVAAHGLHDVPLLAVAETAHRRAVEFAQRNTVHHQKAETQ